MRIDKNADNTLGQMLITSSSILSMLPSRAFSFSCEGANQPYTKKTNAEYMARIPIIIGTLHVNNIKPKNPSNTPQMTYTSFKRAPQ